jgi:hypothetical protein
MYFAQSGDVGHVALLIWAGMASIFALMLLRALNLANTRFDTFVRELERFNRRHHRHNQRRVDHDLTENDAINQSIQRQKRKSKQALQ